MPLETTSFISGLDESWPTGTDPVSEGDDHLRLLKDVLKSQFPGVGGDGFSEAITSTETELNYSQGLTSNIQDQLDSLSDGVDNASFPSGTIMFFYSDTAPPGWTKTNLISNTAMLCVVGSSPDQNAGQTGGSTNPATEDFSHVHGTGDHTLSIDEMPSHDHAMGLSRDSKDGNADDRIWQDGSTLRTGSTGGDNSHNHGNTDSSPVINLRYALVISCSKD